MPVSGCIASGRCRCGGGSDVAPFGPGGAGRLLGSVRPRRVARAWVRAASCLGPPSRCWWWRESTALPLSLWLWPLPLRPRPLLASRVVSSRRAVTPGLAVPWPAAAPGCAGAPCRAPGAVSDGRRPRPAPRGTLRCWGASSWPARPWPTAST